MSYEELTTKQRGYTLDLHKGVQQRDSYIKWYNTENMSLETIDSAASRLASNVKVLALLDELNKASMADSVMTVSQRKERLTELAKEDISDQWKIIRTSNIQAIAELNKMDHVYEEGTINVQGITISIIEEKNAP